MIEANGRNGHVAFDGKIVSINKTAAGSGWGAFVNQGIQGNRAIIAKHITAVEFRTPTKNMNGFIAFDFPGKNPPRGGVFDAAADENAVIFGSDKLPEFEALYTEIVTSLAGV